MLSDDGLKTANEWLRMIVEVYPFCRKGSSPEGEPCLKSAQDRSRHCVITCKLVAASREVLPSRQDLPKFSTELAEQMILESDCDDSIPISICSCGMAHRVGRHLYVSADPGRREVSPSGT